MHRVGVNAFVGGPIPAGARYALLPDMPGVPTGDLQFQEVCEYVRVVLASKGLTEAQDLHGASIAIYVAYELGQPIQQPILAAPTPNPINNSSSHFSGAIIGPGGTYNFDGMATNGTAGQLLASGMSQGIANYQRAKAAREGPLYPKIIRLSAIDYGRYKQKKQLTYYWQITARCTEPSDDLRAAIPILIAAGSNYVGKSSGKVVWVKVAEDDPKLLALKTVN